ncbi:PEPxxWA-CTERM sorting domain-containing protein [Phenylobacterium sp.]|uniref:PEPxxWA-CTERM sorting domain-containing protein n=1 Tax=Phenylobacterium sp. TaxID=1871053 RepID=UPI00301C3CF7
MFKSLAAIVAGTTLLAGATSAGAAVTVDLAGHVNGSWSSEAFFGIPTGDAVVLGGVTFDIHAAGGNAAYVLFDSTPLSIATNVYGVTEVHTLLNTLWGHADASTLSVTFNGSGGATQTFALVGNDDVRDYFQNTYTNAINGVTTQQVFANGPRRLDRQTFVLDPTFATQTLTSIVFTDTGATGYQRGVLTGLTLQTAVVPEPASWAVMILGFGAAGSALRRRRAALA